MIDMLIQGGWFMVPLTLCSIVGLAIAVDRWTYLRSAQQEAEYLLQRIDAAVEQKRIDEIEAVCREHGGRLSAIFVAGVQKYRQLLEDPNLDFVQSEINKTMADASLLSTLELERRLPLLSTIGNVSPLFGFAGTVTGMMAAFERIAATANPSAQTVAAGIREALITTAAGLVVGIPSVLLYNYFTAQIDALNTRIEESANGVVDMLVMALVKRRNTAAGAAR